jgi:hypothetical protein
MSTTDPTARLDVLPAEIEIAQLMDAMKMAGLTSAGLLVFRRVLFDRDRLRDSLARCEALGAERDELRLGLEAIESLGNYILDSLDRLTYNSPIGWR